MSRRDFINEFKRWLDAGRLLVFVKRLNDVNGWIPITPSWSSDTLVYIVDDKYRRLRILQIDEPNVQFQYYNEYTEEWIDCIPDWNINTKFRVKPSEL